MLVQVNIFIDSRKRQGVLQRIRIVISADSAVKEELECLTIFPISRESFIGDTDFTVRILSGDTKRCVKMNLYAKRRKYCNRSYNNLNRA